MSVGGSTTHVPLVSSAVVRTRTHGVSLLKAMYVLKAMGSLSVITSGNSHNRPWTNEAKQQKYTRRSPLT